MPAYIYIYIFAIFSNKTKYLRLQSYLWQQSTVITNILTYKLYSLRKKHNSFFFFFLFMLVMQKVTGLM